MTLMTPVPVLGVLLLLFGVATVAGCEQKEIESVAEETKPPPQKLVAGEACREAWDCQAPLACLEGRCAERLDSGAPCDNDDQCRVGLSCLRSGRCGVDAVGVEEEAPASAPAASSGPAVRVATARREGSVYAQCQPQERLVGGGCRSLAESWQKTEHSLSSYPSEHSEGDTVGARWNCEQKDYWLLEAYALCQTVERPIGVE